MNKRSGDNTMQAEAARHHWTQAEDIAAFYLSRFGDRKLQPLRSSIAATIGLKENSLEMRISNFKYLDTGCGLKTRRCNPVTFSKCTAHFPKHL